MYDIQTRTRGGLLHMISASDRDCNTWSAHSSGFCLLTQCSLRQTEGVFAEPQPTELNGLNPPPLPFSPNSLFCSLCRALQCARALHGRTQSFLISSIPGNHITLTRAKAMTLHDRQLKRPRNTQVFLDQLAWWLVIKFFLIQFHYEFCRLVTNFHKFNNILFSDILISQKQLSNI